MDRCPWRGAATARKRLHSGTASDRPAADCCARLNGCSRRAEFDVVFTRQQTETERARCRGAAPRETRDTCSCCIGPFAVGPALSVIPTETRCEWSCNQHSGSVIAARLRTALTRHLPPTLCLFKRCSRLQPLRQERPNPRRPRVRMASGDVSAAAASATGSSGWNHCTGIKGTKCEKNKSSSSGTDGWRLAATRPGMDHSQSLCALNFLFLCFAVPRHRQHN